MTPTHQRNIRGRSNVSHNSCKRSVGFIKRTCFGFAVAYFIATLCISASGQITITSTGTAFPQDFDSMGSSATATLPTGFRIGTDWSTGTTATTLAFGTTGTGAVTGSSSGGAINWANGVTASATDRSLGFLNTGTFTSPKSIVLKLTNNTGATVTQLEITFDYEKSRSGTRQFDWTFFHGSTVTPSTSATAGDQSYPADANNTTVSNPPTTIGKTVSLTGLSIADGSDYYLKWTFTGLGGSTNGQGIGVDNFSVTANGTAAPTITTSVASLPDFGPVPVGSNSSEQSYTVSGTNLTADISVTAPTDFEVSKTGGGIGFGSAVTLLQAGGLVNSQSVFVRFAPGSAGVKVGNITHDSTGATEKLVAVSGAGTAGGVATYTWTGGSSDWQAAANWSPTRTTPAISDILQFSGGGSITVTNVPTQTVAQLSVSNTTLLTLQASGTNTLTISGASGTDLSLASGSQLNASGSNALTIAVGAGATGSISGSMTFSSGAHKLTSADSSGITFQSGSTFATGTGFSGNSFGNGTANSIIFANGSSYIFNGGGSLFGLTAPASVIVFQNGSLYKHQSSSLPSVAGRTYANFEYNSGGTTSVTGATALTLDNLTVSQGTFNVNVQAGVNLRGNISVALGAALNFNPASASTLAFNGTIAQSISNAGTLSFQSNQDVTLNNTSGLTLNAPITLNGLLTLTNGNITTGPNLLTLGSTATTSGGSTSSYVIGNLLKINVPGSFTFPVGYNAVSAYTPVDLANATGGGDLTISPKTPQQPILTAATSLQEYWTLTEGGTLTADLTFHYLQSDVMGNEANYRIVVVETPGNNATSFPADADHSIDTGANSFTINQVENFSDWTIAEPNAPTAVKLASFEAVANDGEIMLQWQTGYETRNLGYYLYREQNGKRVNITPSLIAGSALIAGPQTKLAAGLNYTWYDRTPQKAPGSEQKAEAVSYWLEDVDLNGTRTLHGPINAIAPEISYGKQKPRELRADLISEVSRRTAVSGVQFNGWAAESRNQMAAAPQSVRQTAKQTVQQPANNPESSMRMDPSDVQRDLAGIAGIKIAVSTAGWYRVTQLELDAAGFEVQDPKQLQLYRNGREVALSLSNNGDADKSSFTPDDYLEFYGHGLDSATEKAQTYYLVNGRGHGKRVVASNAGAKSDVAVGPQSFAHTIERKERMIYFSGLRNGDTENFFGQIVSTEPVSATVPVTHLDAASTTSGTPAQLEVVLQGVSDESHLVQVRFNGIELGAINFANTDHSSQTFAVPASALHAGDNSVRLTSLGGASDISLVDVLRLTYNRSLVADDNVLSFSVRTPQVVRVSGFTNPNLRVLDISDPSSISELKPLVTPEDGGYAAYLEVRQASELNPHTLLAFASGQARHADSVKANNPSSWWSQTAGADYVILTTTALKSAVEPLAQLRRSQGMSVAIVDVEDIYDEFSFGKHSPEAIRSFLQSANKTWKRQPHFVLFAGDASYDPKNYLGQGFNDLVPTKLIDTALNETASDDWLTDFNGDGMSDLAIGRLPVRNVSEANTVVSKIISYENTAPDPSRGALLVADTDFEAPSNAVQSLIRGGLPVQVINRGSTDDATAHNQVIASLNQGPRVANYFGHGSNGIWSSAGLLSTADAPALTNTNRLSVFTMMTCFNGYFQDAYNDSLSEALLKSQSGAVAVWASTTLTEPSGQNVIGAEFYRLLFGPQPITLGDAVRAAKAVTNDADVRRTWTLFGDPAMRLR
ncbi:MAG TPA: C25 family cysteine peptidase [Pyrinomonadaceae bacterium]|nr:C25 family cysteine peptidase [Pyrinomonadaceae bacterium]